MPDWQMFSFILKLTQTNMVKSIPHTKAHREKANSKPTRSYAQPLPQRDKSPLQRTRAARRRVQSLAAKGRREGGEGAGGVCVCNG